MNKKMITTEPNAQTQGEKIKEEVIFRLARCANKILRQTYL